MKIFDNSSENKEKLSRASMEVLPVRLGVVKQAVPDALRSAANELLSRQRFTQTAEQQVSLADRQEVDNVIPIDSRPIVNNKQPTEEPVAVSDRLDEDSVRREVFASYDVPEEKAA